MATAEGPIDARDQGGVRRGARSPLWATVGTATLLALGFSRSRANAPRRSDPARADPALAQPGDNAPALSWGGGKAFLLRIYHRIADDRVVALAAGVTFYALLAIFPAIAALVAIYGLFADPGTISKHLNVLSNLLPGGAIDIIGEEINRVAAQGASKLGTAFLVGIAVSLWSANAGMKALFDTLNIAYRETEKRGLITLNLISLAFTLAAILLLIIALGVIAVLPAVLGYVGLGAQAERLIDVLRWPALVIVVAFAIAVVYRYGPSRSEARWRWITWGSAFAAIMWIVVSILFSWYAANFGSYNKTYGSLGAAIGFMTWMWLSITVVLVGAELDAEMEHRTARDTTVAPRQPLGARSATTTDRGTR